MKSAIAYLAVFTFLVAGTFTVTAQDSKLRKANKLFQMFSYPEAAEAYKKILAKEDIAEAKIKLAECYRYMNKPVEAEYWYEQVVDMSESEDIHKLYYGYALKASGKFDEAKDMFLEYSQLVPGDSRGLRQVEACEKSEYFLTDPGIYTITNLGINSGESDFGPAFYKDGLVFASARGGQFKDKIYNWTGKPFLDLFESEKQGSDDPTSLAAPKAFKTDVNTWLHEATVTFTKDFNKMYFTRDNYLKGKKGKDDEDVIRLKIYEATNDNGGSWKGIKELSFCNDQYSVGHPALSPDEQALYFVSDKPGGYGETDIYVSYKTGNEWGEPENLGPEINTEGREMFPFVDAEGNLYFASDALPGLGGLDIFISSPISGGWTAAQNLRYPINTNADDFGFIIHEDESYGYFASNRSSGKGDDDIYAFTKQTMRMNGVVVDCETDEPLEDALVQLMVGEILMQEFTTTEDGTFSFPIGPNMEYTVMAEKNNYEQGTQEISTAGIDGQNVEVKVPLCP